MGKGLLNKLKIGFAGLSLIGASYFNSVNAIKAQEIVFNPNQETSNYKKSSKNYPTLIHKLIEFENEPLNGETTCSSLEISSLDYVIKNMGKHVPKKPASELSKKEAQKIFEGLYSKKVLDVLKTSCKLDTKEVSYNEFFGITE